MKTIISAISLMALGTPVLAGPYVNIESNTGFAGHDYQSSLLETHVGYENSLGWDSNWYIQAGPAVTFKDGATGEVSGKVGLTTALTERLSAYGEVAAVTTNEYDFSDLNTNIKAGLKYTF